ncbi:unnamed protein product [marine sediment metagenome]|uniref:Uncharacterized protein n=1 Tax=marine sediment metagenome TaxID=412755 RepID=X1IP71_9ZZZZ
MSDNTDKQIQEAEMRGLLREMPWRGALEKDVYIMRDRHGSVVFAESHLKPIAGDYIVRACNAHRALAEALKCAKSCVGGSNVRENPSLWVRDKTQERIDAALALAKEPGVPEIIETLHAKRGEVYQDKATGRKFAVRNPHELASDKFEKVADRPHGDGDFSYVCGSDYCRCMQ